LFPELIAKISRKVNIPPGRSVWSERGQGADQTATLGLAILASNSDESDEGGLAGSPPPRKKLRTATNSCPTVLSPNSTATMQQPQTTKNGCSTFDTNNGSANDDTAGSSSTGTGSLLPLKDVDGIVGGSRHYHDQGFT